MTISKRIQSIKKDTIFSELPPFPHVLMLEPSSACNHSCMFCGNKHRPSKQYNLPLETARDILDQAFTLGARELGLYLRGEPFLNPALADMVAHAKSRGYEYVYLSTNGGVGRILDYENVLKAGLNSFKFSINAGTREEYTKVHGKDDFPRIMERLQWLIDYRRSSGLDFKIYVSSTYIASTRTGIFALRDTIAPLIDEFYTHGTCPLPGETLEEVDHGFKLPCPMIFNRIHVTAEGFVNPCCFDFHNALALADLHQVSLEEAWRGARFTDLRRRHLSGEVSGTMCGNCVSEGVEPYEPIAPELACME